MTKNSKTLKLNENIKNTENNKIKTIILNINKSITASQ